MTEESSSQNPTDGDQPDEPCAGPNLAWFAPLVDEMMPVMTRAAWAITRDWQRADDAAQEAFWLFAQRHAGIEPADRRGWLVQTVVFKAKELRRAEGRQKRLAEKWLLHRGQGLWSDRLPESAREFASDGFLAEDDASERLAAAIQQLPAEQKRTVLLRMNDGLTFAQIADRVDAPVSTVLSRMRLAMKKLRVLMK